MEQNVGQNITFKKSGEKYLLSFAPRFLNFSQNFAPLFLKVDIYDEEKTTSSVGWVGK